MFAITVEKKQEEQPIAEEQANKTEEMPAEKQEQASAEQGKEPRQRIIGYVFLVMIVIAIITLIIIFGLKRKKNLKK